MSLRYSRTLVVLNYLYGDREPAPNILRLVSLGAESEQRCPVLVAEPVNEDDACAKRFAGRLNRRLNVPNRPPRGRSTWPDGVTLDAEVPLESQAS